ncbi:MAG: LysR substrate-binding domain-containing protein [Magnetovibrio sp.]|nr:LysR substrate-binding domain-containing protein [Magnetovibrio sp.]
MVPSIRQLRYLVALAEEEHFGRAADKCFVTQSTLSASIQELEEILGAVLFERTKRSVMITQLGRDTTARARAVLQGVDDLVEHARAERDPLSGGLSLGAIPTIGPFLLPRVLPALRASYPSLTLYLREDQTARLLEQVRAGDLDAALIALPWETDGLSVQEVMLDRLWLAVPGAHALAGRKRIGRRDVDPSELILLEGGHCLRDHALGICPVPQGRRRPNPNQRFQGTSLFTLAEMVANGLGATVLPELAIGSEVMPKTGVAFLPLRERQASRRVVLVWRKTSARKGEFRLLGHFLRNALAESGAA